MFFFFKIYLRERETEWHCNIDGWLILDLARTAQVVIAFYFFYFYFLYFAFIFDSLNLYLAIILNCMHCNYRAPKIVSYLSPSLLYHCCVCFMTVQGTPISKVRACLFVINWIVFEKWNKRNELLFLLLMFVYIFYVLSWNNR